MTPCSLDAHYVFRLQALGALANFKLDSLAVIQRFVPLRLNCGEVDENVLAGLPLDEAETLASIEPLYRSLFSHEIPLLLSYLVAPCTFSREHKKRGASVDLQPLEHV